ncbi:multidrug effflux MFS transporter [Roseomonas sp. OT10]|uniref:multidrug effflux MFS transporter n=1 Tax=Roseomonas cutis TaxID=2897332 RepID=UPI001E3BCD5B|nr:multidrug effflux MFS transporter [Roseomonas sp. OT10]UFN49666.1 multidrug effflux MFS transporter [Roseomonas sp. OT10]
MTATPPVPAVTRPALWLMMLCSFCGTLAMHMLVPALPEAGRALQAGAATMQMTVSLYMAGLAIGQLFYGPLSDRFGRRPVLLAGLGVYSLGGLAATLAPSAGMLIGARLVQALGGCAGLALTRAMVRDTTPMEEAASRLALLNMVVAVGPAAAPLLGGFLAEWLGWRWVLATTLALGVTALVAAFWRLPETRPPGGANTSPSLRDYGQLLRSPVFLGFTIGGGCATTSMYAFLAASPFIVVEQMHRPVHELGLYYLLLVGGTSFGNLLAARLVRPMGSGRLLLAGSLLGLSGALMLLGAALSGHLLVPLVVGPMLLFTIGVGIASPVALTRAVSVNPRLIGSASGLYGFSQMAVGAVCTSLAGLGTNPALSSAVVLTGASLLGLVCFLTALRSRPAGA